MSKEAVIVAIIGQLPRGGSVGEEDRDDEWVIICLLCTVRARLLCMARQLVANDDIALRHLPAQQRVVEVLVESMGKGFEG